MKNFDIIARALSTNNELISQCQTDINAIKGKEPSKPFYEIDLTVLLNNLTLNGNKNDIPTENILNVFDKISLAYSGLETRLSAYQFTLKPNLAPYNLPAGAPKFISSIPCDINVIDYSGDKVVNIIFIYKNINNTLSEMQFGFVVKADNSIVNGFIRLNAFVSSDDLTRIDATIEENELVISNALTQLNNTKADVKHTHSEYLTEHQDISGKQDVISDLATIRSGASKGATALQSVPSEYVTETELNGKGYATSSYVDGKFNTVNSSIDTLNATVGTNNSGKNLVERVTQLEDGIGVPDARAKVLWLGTSIPAGDPNNNYPNMVGEMLGFEIHNMSQAASCLHWDPTPPTWTTSAEVEANRTAGRCLTATRQEIRDKFYTVLDNIRRTERLSTTWRDNLIAEFQEASYETRVIPYLDGTIASCDTVVIDHGFNDMMAIYNECVQHANTAKDETSYWPDDVAASMGLPSGIAYPTPDGVKGWHWLTNLSTGRDYYADTFMNTIYTTALGLMDGYADTTFRYEYFGAFMFLIAKIMKVNPRARIVVGNYFSQNCGDFIDNRSSWLTKYVLEANQQLANWLGYLCVNTYKYTGLRNRLIVRPDGTQVYDMYLFCPADGVHPSTDTTGESNRLLAGIYINALRGLFFK